MNFFKNLKIGTRLGLGFAIVILASIAIAAYARVSLGMLKNELDLLTDDRIVKIEQLTEVKNNLNIIARHIRNIALMNDEKAMAEEKVGIDKARAGNSELLKKLDKTIKAEKARALLKTLEEVRGRYNTTIDKAVAAGLAKSDQTRELVLNVVRPTQEEYFFVLDDLITFQHSLMKDSSDAVETRVEQASLIMIGIALLAIFGGAFIAWSTTRSVTRPIGEAVKLAEAVAAGDLTGTVEIRSQDETGQLLAALRRMNESLQQIVGQVRTSSDSIATGSQQIATGNTDLSQRTEEQASNLQQTAASMEQLTSTVKNNAGTAQEANRMAGSASATAAKGGEAMLQVVATMEEISGSSKKIADIISVIDGIAFQTNILALNAAVEAARAGEQGRGFAVVASEVRNLAQRSATAAKEIKSLIGDSVEKVNNGTQLVSAAGRTMDEIVNQVKHVSQLINEISAATGEQTSGIEQIGDAVTQLDQVTQQNAALVEQSAAAAESLKDQAFKLTEAVSVFKIAAH